MYRKATVFHSSEQCHLPFGKLMNADFKSTEHLFKTDFPNYIFRDIFIFQTIINKVCSRNPRIKQSLDLIYHSTVKPFLQTPANLGTTGITVNSYTDNDGFYCRERSILRGVFKILGFNLYRPDSTLTGVYIGLIMHHAATLLLQTLQHLCQLFKRFIR